MAKTERPRRTAGHTTHFEVGESSGYVTTGCNEAGEVIELFLKVAKQGSTIGGLVDTIAIITSHALQNGTPLGDLLRGMSGLRFEPNGETDDPEIPMAASIPDYLAKRLALDYLLEDDPDRQRIMSR